MTDLPPELFSERPVVSDHSWSGPSYAVRRLITLVFAVLLVAGGVYWAFSDTSPSNPQDIPVIKAEGNYKQRPEQPGGIDIPHQDVQVYQELDAKNNDKDQVEHLLPPPETPQISDNQAPMAAPQVTAPHIESLMANTSAPEATSVPTTVSAVGSAPVTVAAPSAPLSIVPHGEVIQNKTPEINAKVNTLPSTSSPPAIVLSSPPPVPTVQALPPAIPPGKLQTAAAPIQTLPAVSAPPAIKPQTTIVPKQDSLTIDQIIKNVSQNKPTSVQGSSSSSKGIVFQLASLPDQDSAQKDMLQLKTKYTTVLGSVPLYVVRADLAKGTYYRIQGRVTSEDQARSICANLKKLNAGCILVTAR